MIAPSRLSDPTPSRRWESLHLLRAVASIAVVAHHVPHFLRTHVTYSFPSFEAGAAGVDVFFVISGFVMYCAVHRAPPAWHDFLAKRAIRVVPMYGLATIAVTAAVWVVPSAFARFRVTPEQLVKSLLFLPVYDPSGEIRPVIGVGWTLHFELLFYLLVAAALPVARTRAAMAAAAVLSGAAVISSILGLPAPFSAWQLLGLITVEFALGVGLARALHTTRVLEAPRWTRVAVCCVLFTFAMIRVSSALPQGVGFDRLVTWGFGGASLVASLALLEPELRSARTLETWYGPLGDASYALYLVHGSIFPITWKLLSEGYRSHHTTTWATLLIVPIIVSLPTHYFVEKPVTQTLSRGFHWMKRLFSVPPSPDSVERYGS